MSSPRKLLREIDALNASDLLWLHREVCRRAARIYGPIHQAKRDANWGTAMAQRDTRFQKGLSVHENIARTRRA